MGDKRFFTYGEGESEGEWVAERYCGGKSLILKGRGSGGERERGIAKEDIFNFLYGRMGTVVRITNMRGKEKGE